MLFFCDAVWADSTATIASRVGSKGIIVKRVISFVTSRNPEKLPPSDLAPRFVFWGRVHHQKGLDRAIDFIRMLHERDCSASYEIWGPDGGESAALLAQIRDADLDQAISFRGIADKNQLADVAGANCFYLQLSREEGMAMSVVEAMQHSLLPVVSPVGEISTYCRHNYNAIVVKDPDNPIDAVNDIICLLNDEPRYLRLQAKSSEHWRNHVLYRDDICLAAHELCNQIKRN